MVTLKDNSSKDRTWKEKNSLKNRQDMWKDRRDVWGRDSKLVAHRKKDGFVQDVHVHLNKGYFTSLGKTLEIPCVCVLWKEARCLLV